MRDDLVILNKTLPNHFSEQLLVRLVAGVFHGFQRNGVMIELEPSGIVELLWGWVVVNGRWKDRRLTKRPPIRSGMSFELDFTGRKHMTPSPPVVSLLGQYLVFIFLPEGVQYPRFSSRGLRRRCRCSMGGVLISLGLGFPLSLVLAPTMPVVMMAVMTIVVAGVMAAVVAVVVSLRRFRWTMASWPCVLVLRNSLIMAVHFSIVRVGRWLCGS
mmetsp:Transcript_27646/g.79810  ORF Transcript_27646/g.79810 Transcript_27646/m.79810 type:complete len:214 (+) Transcript_27646:2882-3523(+)